MFNFLSGLYHLKVCVHLVYVSKYRIYSVFREKAKLSSQENVTNGKDNFTIKETNYKQTYILMFISLLLYKTSVCFTSASLDHRYNF